MKTIKDFVKGEDGKPIDNFKALLWGNNAAWLCTECGELLGNRTGDYDYRVKCTTENCTAEYEIERSRNRSGSFHMGPATGVRKTR